jgi:Uma2 family endonuclease
MEALSKKKYSLAEYQQLEEESGIRYEYHDGEVFAMSGGSLERCAIATNVSDLLRGHLPVGCRRFNSDLKVYVETLNKGFYFDLTIACRPIEKPNVLNYLWTGSP